MMIEPEIVELQECPKRVQSALKKLHRKNWHLWFGDDEPIMDNYSICFNNPVLVYEKGYDISIIVKLLDKFSNDFSVFSYEVSPFRLLEDYAEDRDKLGITWLFEHKGMVYHLFKNYPSCI